MDIKTQLQQTHSKANNQLITEWIGSSYSRFLQLLDCIRNGDSRTIQRASWAAGEVIIKNPSFLDLHWDIFLSLLNEAPHNGVTRNIIRIFEHITIPEEYHGTIMNICFEKATTPKEKPAIKSYALAILMKFTQQYPDIIPELKLIVHEQWENEGAAFRSKGNKINKLQK